jgi:hypothetical protein
MTQRDARLLGHRRQPVGGLLDQPRRVASLAHDVCREVADGGANPRGHAARSVVPLVVPVRILTGYACNLR